MVDHEGGVTLREGIPYAVLYIALILHKTGLQSSRMQF